MEFLFAIALIVVVLVIPALIKRARRPPAISKFADHEIINPDHLKIARCKKCRKTFEWKGSAWKLLK